MSDLADFQTGFLSALPGGRDALSAQAGLQVYRNTIAKGRADALAASFPTVGSIVGEDWLAAAANLYGREHPPVTPVLMAYGAGFPDWLAAFPHAADMPYLADIARIDWLWSEACFSADAEPLDMTALTGLPPEVLARAWLVPHPATRIGRFETAIPSLWLTCQAAFEGEVALAPESEGLLIVRPQATVSVHAVAPAAVAFLEACCARLPVEEAAHAALAEDPSADLSALLASLITQGAFSALLSIEEPRP